MGSKGNREKRAGSIRDAGGLVYSSELGAMCPACGRSLGACVCRGAAQPASAAGWVRVGRETQGRKGKGVTVIAGVPLPAGDLAALATQLKKKCGSGGTLKGGVIEIQGDHRDALVRELEGRGWKVKRSGG